MKAIVIHRPGGPEQLLYREVPTPEVRPGWSLVKVKGFGINHSEIFTRQGLSPGVQFPRILGIECVGEVAQSSSPALREGQRVISLMGEMGRAFDGSYAEYVLLPNEQIYPVATALDWPILAAVPETYYTAYGSLRKLQIRPRDRVLVRGAPSGVGVAFARLLKAQYPAIVLHGSSRSPAKGERLRAVGFDEIILDDGGRLQSGDHYDKILELIGPATLRDSFAHIAEGGMVCQTGLLGGQWQLDGFDPITELQNDSYLTSFHSALVSAERLAALFHHIDAYRVGILVERVFHLEQVPEAHRFLESAAGFGKVVVLNS